MKIKFNKLQGLIATYYDESSSENEFIVAGQKAKKMIIKELNCPLWTASCIVEILWKKEIWFPHPTREHLHGTRPSNAMTIFKEALLTLGIRYTTTDYGMGGTNIKL